MKTADLLAKIAKKPAPSKATGFTHDGLPDIADKTLLLIRQAAELERELNLAKDEARRAVEPWYHDQLKDNGHEPSVRLIGQEGTLRLTFQHRYNKLPAEAAGKLREVVDGRFDTYFTLATSLKVKKDVAEDAERLNALVLKLAKALGAEFSEVFEAEQTIAPTKAFTERRWSELSESENERLERAGVRQVCAFGEGK